MRNVLTIAGREIRSYFVSPIAYVVLTGFLLLGGLVLLQPARALQLLLAIYSAHAGIRQMLERLNLNDS